jgi:hypothetical protein
MDHFRLQIIFFVRGNYGLGAVALPKLSGYEKGERTYSGIIIPRSWSVFLACQYHARPRSAKKMVYTQMYLPVQIMFLYGTSLRYDCDAMTSLERSVLMQAATCTMSRSVVWSTFPRYHTADKNSLRQKGMVYGSVSISSSTAKEGGSSSSSIVTTAVADGAIVHNCERDVDRRHAPHKKCFQYFNPPVSHTMH